MGNMTVQVKRPNQEINVNITDMDNLEIMKFLRDIINDDTKVLNVPITQELTVTKGEGTTVQYPTSRNLLEPTEKDPVNYKNVSEVDVDCPECQVKHVRNGKLGGVAKCYCGTPLLVEQGENGRYKAVQRFRK